MLTDQEYELACQRANAIAEIDPDLGTAEADELMRLAKRIEEYERHFFPHLFRNTDIITGDAE